MAETKAMDVKISNIIISENFRKTIDKNSIKELSKSIEKLGVLEPIIIRKDKDELILVAGARRLMAAQMAKLTEIPARVMSITEEEAQLVQAIENLHRENLNPIEEAEQFEVLIKSKTRAELADEIGKSLKYVYRSMALLDLPKEIKAYIKAGKLQPAHGHLFLRVPEGRTEKVMAFIKGEVDHGIAELRVSDLKRFIDSNCTRDLKYAKFNKDECAKCASCSKNQSMLFDNVEDSICDNPECFKKKAEDHDRQVAEKLAKSKLKGLKPLGAKNIQVGWNDRGFTKVGKGLLVTDELKKIPEVKKALEKEKEKFGFVLKPGTTDTSIVLTDKELVEKINKMRASKGGEETDWDKVHYIRDMVSERLLESLMKMKVTKEEIAMAIALSRNISERITERFVGKDEDLNEKNLKKLSTEDILKMCFIDAIMDDSDLREALLEDNKDIKKELAKTEEEAEKAWPEVKKSREEEEKKKKEAAAEKKETAQENEEEDQE